MDALKQQRQALIDKINKLNTKLFSLQNELFNIEHTIIDFDHQEIIETLTLNKQQAEIINSTDQYSLVIACPGSGKTHTLISMYIKLIIEDKIDPNDVLLITFTKKAGNEMLGRLSSLVPTKLPAYVGSLHGLGYHILQEYYETSYTILDEMESKQMIKELCDEYINDNQSALIKMKIISIIDKASSYYPFNLIKVLNEQSLEKFHDNILLVYNKYQEKKQLENLFDFNDLMISFCQFLDKDESLSYKNKIKFIFFDEYQDINPIQHYILSKFKIKSRIMVVGDDAQSIYAFRGSSVNHILNFPKEFTPNKMYLLEKNYRSTSNIVNFFQDIIIKNMNQYKKDVISNTNIKGNKPIVIGFIDNKYRDEWIVNDIIKHNKAGMELSKMVILARKNKSLDEIEITLVKHGITVIKHTGLSILDKPHVKDFLAFVVILINDKSSLHWKRVLSLHVGVPIAHKIIESAKTNSIRESIKKLKDTQVQYANKLKQLDTFLDSIYKSAIKDVDKARHIITYLEKIWSSNSEKKVKDILILVSFLVTSTFKDFINDLYLNQSIEANLDNTIYLTTIHGSKGLEWENVYLIDVDSDTIPLGREKQEFFINECDEIDEERRLLYVACSRAKSNLVITYNYNMNPSSLLLISPFIREINPLLYNAINVDYTSYKLSGLINVDVSNYLKYTGFTQITPILRELKYDKLNIHESFETNASHLSKIKYSHIVINNFMDYLIMKMIHINFTKYIKKFNLGSLTKICDIKIKQNYIDDLSDWRNLLDDIFHISTLTIKDDANIFDDLKKILINDCIHYNKICDSLTSYINSFNPKKIELNYSVSHAEVKGRIDLLVDNVIFKIRTPSLPSSSNIIQTLLHCYILKKNKMEINKMILYNPLSGNITSFDLLNIDFKKIAKIIYSI